jgi:Fe2+ or Zn2+ uptake regulation protein
MKTKIATKVLENLKVSPTEEKLFVLETLIKEKKIKRSNLIDLLKKQKNLTDYQVRNLLQSLNQSGIIKWTVTSGGAIVRLTAKAEAECIAVECDLFTEEIGEKFVKKLSKFADSLDECVSSLKKEGGEIKAEVAEALADSLTKFADKLRNISTKK